MFFQLLLGDCKVSAWIPCWEKRIMLLIVHSIKHNMFLVTHIFHDMSCVFAQFRFVHHVLDFFVLNIFDSHRPTSGLSGLNFS